MENVRNIVDGVLEARGWSSKVLEQMAVELWPEVVGDTIAKNTLAEKFKAGTLHIRARSPQWTQELHFHEARVITRLNGRLRRPLVQKIRCYVTPPRGIKVGALKPNWEDPTFPAQAPMPIDRRLDPDDATVQQARRICSAIEDPEMRATMEKLIATSLRASQERNERDALADKQKAKKPVESKPAAPARKASYRRAKVL
ncbi:MAG: hypothetical protein JWN98_25 [Abditibacteriota bacterium]|nr:hypothetical protein [Abditibacteriota bacterium]